MLPVCGAWLAPWPPSWLIQRNLPVMLRLCSGPVSISMHQQFNQITMEDSHPFLYNDWEDFLYISAKNMAICYPHTAPEGKNISVTFSIASTEVKKLSGENGGWDENGQLWELTNEWVSVLLWGLGAAITTLCVAATISHPMYQSHIAWVKWKLFALEGSSGHQFWWVILLYCIFIKWSINSPSILNI